MTGIMIQLLTFTKVGSVKVILVKLNHANINIKKIKENNGTFYNKRSR